MRLLPSLLAGNNRVLILSLVATAVLSLLPISSHATVDWNEGFEYASDAALGAVWDTSCLGNPGVSTSRPRSGSKSLRLVYNGKVGVDPGAGGCFIDRYLPALSDTVYIRTYVFLENFTVDSVGTKMIFVGQSGSYPNFWWEMYYGAPNFNMSITSLVPNSFNIGGGSIPQNQWVCLEGRITMNTPGAANGIIQSWVNGAQQINQTTAFLRNAVLIQQNGPNSRLQLVRLYTQHGRGVIYYDDFAVSRDARIGCSGSPPPAGDTTPPVPPVGVFLR